MNENMQLQPTTISSHLYGWVSNVDPNLSCYEPSNIFSEIVNNFPLMRRHNLYSSMPCICRNKYFMSRIK